MKVDPICAMKVNENEARKKKLFVSMHGNEFFFCGNKCKTEFLEKPVVYPNHCVNCMKKTDLGKTVWKIKHKDVIYCFCSEECKKEFEIKKFGGVIY